MAGIPHYLKEVQKGESAAQAIDRICFAKDGLLNDEFKNLYHSLFDDVNRHLKIIRALATNKAGLTRNQIMEESGLSSGGTVTELLEELIESQIDLLIDRKDFAINICEMKYTEKEFAIDKAYANELENKRSVFKEAINTRKSLFLTLVTTFGVQPNDYVTKSVQATVTMDALFD